MQLVSFEASQKQINWDKFGEHLREEYKDRTSRDLLNQKKLDFEKKLIEAGRKFEEI